MEVDKVVPTGTTIPLPAGLADDETFTAAEGETVTIEDIGDLRVRQCDLHGRYRG